MEFQWILVTQVGEDGTESTSQATHLHPHPDSFFWLAQADQMRVVHLSLGGRPRTETRNINKLTIQP